MSASRIDVSVSPVTVNILSWKRAYLVGIKGVGMTSLAVLLQQAGVVVSGSDVSERFVTDALLDQTGISVEEFSQASLPSDVDGVIFSGAHRGSLHALVQDARDRRLPTLTLAEAVGALSSAKKTVVTCGVGGKSTTSAWLSLMLTRANLDPAFSVGVGTIPDLGTSGKWGSGEWFIVEGDEYVSDPVQERVIPRFLYLHPFAVLCTGIAYDHPDVYSSEDDTCRAFGTLWQRIPAEGVVVVRSGDRLTEQVLQQYPVACRVIRVGESADADVQCAFTPTPTGTTVELTWKNSGNHTQAEIQLLGMHNAWNAALSAVLAQEIGVASDAVQQGMREFHSTPRRFEFKGVSEQGWRCYDDYAHHPKELAAISQTLTEWFSNQRVVVAFQPHTYSRTKALWNDFVQVLAKMPGKVCVLPIFSSARESDDPSVQISDLVSEINQAGGNAEMAQTDQDLLKYLQDETEPGVFITLGAGDVYLIYEQLTRNSH